MQREIPQEGARSARDRRWRPRLAHQGSRADDRRLVVLLLVLPVSVGLASGAVGCGGNRGEEAGPMGPTDSAPSSGTVQVTLRPALRPPEELTAVWGSGPHDVWAVGSGVTYHWDGQRWTSAALASAQASPPHGVRLQSVWGTDPTNVWTVGNPLEFRHWDGRTWKHLPPNGGIHAFGLWGSSAEDVWAVGATTKGGVFHWDGADWTWQLVGSSAGTSYLNAIWGSGANDVWAVGGGVDGDVGPVEAHAFHWDGGSWTPRPTGLRSPLQSVWGSGPMDVWAVGRAGTITHWDGQAWSPSPSGTTQMLWSVWGSGRQDVWAVGDAGIVLHWTGTTWSRVPTATTSPLRGVWGSGPGDVWVVGHQVILHLPSSPNVGAPSVVSTASQQH